MTALGPVLKSLGLSQYLERFVAEGFDTWETLQDITEADFEALDVKRGHRRKLQREIASARGIPIRRSLRSPSPSSKLAAEERSKEADELWDGEPAEPASSHSTQPGKRKYRRHPKVDESAPGRPPSAYVIFSNKTREDLKGQNLSFTEIAKLVGQNWQHLSPEEKSFYEAQAAAAKQEYQRKLSDYKKTDKYKEYLKYLADFRAKHGEGKRAKRGSDAAGGSGGGSGSGTSSVAPTFRTQPKSSYSLVSSEPGRQGSEAGYERSELADGNDSDSSSSVTFSEQRSPAAVPLSASSASAHGRSPETAFRRPDGDNVGRRQSASPTPMAHSCKSRPAIDAWRSSTTLSPTDSPMTAALAAGGPYQHRERRGTAEGRGSFNLAGLPPPSSERPPFQARDLILPEPRALGARSSSSSSSNLLRHASIPSLTPPNGSGDLGPSGFGSSSAVGLGGLSREHSFNSGSAELRFPRLPPPLGPPSRGFSSLSDTSGSSSSHPSLPSGGAPLLGERSLVRSLDAVAGHDPSPPLQAQPLPLPLDDYTARFHHQQPNTQQAQPSRPPGGIDAPRTFAASAHHADASPSYVHPPPLPPPPPPPVSGTVASEDERAAPPGSPLLALLKAGETIEERDRIKDKAAA